MAFGSGGLVCLVQVAMMWSQASAQTPLVSLAGVVQDPIALQGARFSAIVGNYALVGGQYDDGISVLDISDPTNLTFVSSIKDRQLVRLVKAIDIAGDYAYVIRESTNTATVVAVNIADPRNLTIAGTYEFSDYNVMSGPGSIVVAGGFAYATGEYSDTLVVVNLTDPSNLTLAGYVKSASELDSPRQVRIAGDYALVACANIDSLTMVSISDPSNPSIAGRLGDPTRLDVLYGSAVAGDLAYATSFANDYLTVINISDPNSMSIVGELTNSTLLDAVNNVHIVGNYAYMTALFSNSFVVVDIADPGNPTIVGSFKSAVDLYYPTGLTIAGDLAYITAEQKDGDIKGEGLAVVNISNPHNPTFVSFFGEIPHSYLEQPEHTAVKGGYAYVSGEEGSVTVIDISDPTSPRRVAHFYDKKLDGAEGIKIAGDYIYVAANDYEGLIALSITDPINPTIVGSIQDDDLFDGATDVAIAGNYAFVTCYSEDAVTVVDISPKQPHSREPFQRLKPRWCREPGDRRGLRLRDGLQRGHSGGAQHCRPEEPEHRRTLERQSEARRGQGHRH